MSRQRDPRKLCPLQISLLKGTLMGVGLEERI